MHTLAKTVNYYSLHIHIYVKKYYKNVKKKLYAFFNWEFVKKRMEIVYLMINNEVEK